MTAKTAELLPVVLCLSLCVGQSAWGDSPQTDGTAQEVVEVLGIAPAKGDLDSTRIPYAMQHFTQADLNSSGTYSVAEVLSQRATSVTFNSAQGNRLQNDLRFRGYTASPLLGLPQGMAVYQNGVRVNEAFGDSVNWDLLPASSVESMQLVAGANPVYGLNALGGTIVVNTKTGFSAPESTVTAGIGSHQARELAITHGGNNGEWGYFLAIDGMEEDGWRDFSESEAQGLYSALSWRGTNRELDLYFTGANTRLRGNGAVPEVLLAQQREAVFTHPDITDNLLAQFSAAYRQYNDTGGQFNFNVFYRHITTDSFNGDGSEFEECDEPADEGFLCDEEEEERVEDQFGNAVPDSFDAINNRSRRRQHSAGLTAQWIQQAQLFGLPQQFVVGADYSYGSTDFSSSVEFAALTDTRGTRGSGLYDEEGNTQMSARSRTAALYFSDLITLTDQLSLTVSARYNDTQIDNRDLSGERPELYGSHNYQRFNAGLGMVYQWSEQLSVYGSAQQSSRAPTPVELACSHPEAPCNLPNSFLADPPLDDVVSRSVEAGLRGSNSVLDEWRLGVFHSTNRDDIIFQTTGGVSSNQGFFTNAADTVRKGVELDFTGSRDRWQWYFSYTYLHASFDSGFLSSSANHPEAEDGSVPVASGSRLPGLPEHSAKLGVDYQLSERLRLGVETLANSGLYLRGDEANRDAKTASYGVANVSASYQWSDSIEWRFKVENVLDKEYETFGLYGEADEVLEDIDDDNGRFVGPGAPRQFWLSVVFNW